MKNLILIITLLFSTYTFGQNDKRAILNYPNGTVEEIRQYDKKSRKTGEWIMYYENGTISGVGYFVKGKKEGAWRTYDINGRLVYLITYKNDKRVNTIHWSENSGLLVKSW